MRDAAIVATARTPIGSAAATLAADEGIRAGTTVEGLASLGTV